MAKNKYKLSQLHKIKVHHNRWLIWTVAYLLFVAIALVGYIQVSDVDFDTEQLVAENTFSPWHSYANAELGFSLRYPSSWAIEPDSTSSLNFVPQDLTKPGVNVSVYALSAEKILRKSLAIVGEQVILVDGIPAAQITSQTKEGESMESVVLVSHNKKLYVIRGNRASVLEFVQTINFSAK